jgi:hypothetical protein
MKILVFYVAVLMFTISASMIYHKNYFYARKEVVLTASLMYFLAILIVLIKY